MAELFKEDGGSRKERERCMTRDVSGVLNGEAKKKCLLIQIADATEIKTLSPREVRHYDKTN